VRWITKEPIVLISAEENSKIAKEAIPNLTCCEVKGIGIMADCELEKVYTAKLIVAKKSKSKSERKACARTSHRNFLRYFTPRILLILSISVFTVSMIFK
jgi:hypothetical protein